MRERIYRFMQGRYGQDAFSRFLLGAVLVCIVLNGQCRHMVFAFLCIFSYFFQKLCSSQQRK